MAPPMAAAHEHHDMFHHHHHVEEGEEEDGEGSPHHHHEHHHEEEQKTRKKSAVEEDLAPDGGGCRRELWLFLHGEEPNADHPAAYGNFRRYARKYEFFSVFLVLYLVLADIVTSIPSVADWTEDNKLLDQIEAVIYAFFTLEYLLRMWSCMESKTWSEKGSIKGRLTFGREVLQLVDFIVLISYYIGFLIPGGANTTGFAALRMVRLFRVAALLKVERKANSFAKIFNVLKKKKNELIATLFTAVVLMVMSATTMYYIESGTNDDFSSVPAAMWWSVTALTTVGYGDVTPTTSVGKVLGSIVAFFGVGLFALPAGILGSGFVEEVEGDAEGEEEDVGDELLEELDEEKKKIENLANTVEGIRKTVEGVAGAQKEITDLMKKLIGDPASKPGAAPTAANGPRPDGGGNPGFPSPLAYSPMGPEKDLVSLQESVVRKLDTMRRSRTAELTNAPQLAN
mmetsp:Transcript_92886/g.161403  ORF Transcript_92886/g.161403 Transcript_92886/m.161403 type:complete len:456 (-) Transcript_92886:14-1381(-)